MAGEGKYRSLEVRASSSHLKKVEQKVVKLQKISGLASPEESSLVRTASIVITVRCCCWAQCRAGKYVVALVATTANLLHQVAHFKLLSQQQFHNRKPM